MPSRSESVEDIRARLLSQLDSHGDSAIVALRDFTAWVVRCTDFQLGAVYRWTIVGLDELPREDSAERYTACDQAARALIEAINRSAESAA